MQLIVHPPPPEKLAMTDVESMPLRTPPLPTAPATEDMLTTIGRRLTAIEHHSLPAVRARRAFLERVWSCDVSSSVPIYVQPGVAISCDPAGADRLATTLAEEDALLREASALRDLAEALADYAMGGRLTRAEIEGPEAGSALVLGAVDPRTRVAETGPRRPATFREYLQQLRMYRTALEKELTAARKSGRGEHIASLEVEYHALCQRVDAVPDEARAAARQRTRSSARREPRRREAAAQVA